MTTSRECAARIKARRIAANIAKLPELLRKPSMSWFFVGLPRHFCFSNFLPILRRTKHTLHGAIGLHIQGSVTMRRNRDASRGTGYLFS